MVSITSSITGLVCKKAACHTFPLLLKTACLTNSPKPDISFPIMYDKEMKQDLMFEKLEPEFVFTFA